MEDTFDEWVDEDDDEADVTLEIFHGRLEELELGSMFHSSVRVACTNLKKLVWGVGVGETLIFPTLECPRLKSLELSGYDHMFRSIPGILSVLPSLEALRCECHLEVSKHVVFEHQNIRDLQVTQMEVECHGSEFKLNWLTLIMPSLVRVEVVHSIEHVRVVASSEKVVVKYTPHKTSGFFKWWKYE